MLMLILLCVLPFAIIVAMEIRKHGARVKHKQQMKEREKKEKEMAFEAVKEKWKPYALGADGVEKFKEDVKKFWQEYNLHFANKCCMEMRPLSYISFEIVDEYLKENYVDRFLSQTPRCSYAEAERVFYVKGKEIAASFEFWQTGAAILTWDGGAREEFASWEDMITFLDSKIGA